jgi:hypothetical protein
LGDDLGLSFARLHGDMLLDIGSEGLNCFLDSSFDALVDQPLKIGPKRLRQMHYFLVKLEDFLMMRTHIFLIEFRIINI